MKKHGALCPAGKPEVSSPGICIEEGNMTTLLAKRSAGGNQLWLFGYLNSYFEYGCSVCETPDSAFLIRGAASTATARLCSDGCVVVIAAGSHTYET
jgi:hypothetical protein